MQLKNLLIMAVLALAACSQSTEREDLSPRGVQRMNFAVPAPLTEKTVDLNSKESVAKALGIKLSGDPKQKLYDIVMSAPSSEGKLETRTIEIRVDNLKKGSSIIYGVQGSNYEAPKAAKKSPAKKAPAKKK